MEADKIAKIIHEFNLSYLLLAKYLFSEDKVSAAFRLGISDDILNKISLLSLPQLLKLSEANQLICNLRFNGAEIDCLTKESRIDELQCVHTGILLSSQLLAELKLN